MTRIKQLTNTEMQTTFIYRLEVTDANKYISNEKAAIAKKILMFFRDMLWLYYNWMQVQFFIFS